jgi:hypothetical protein
MAAPVAVAYVVQQPNGLVIAHPDVVSVSVVVTAPTIDTFAGAAPDVVSVLVVVPAPIGRVIGFPNEVIGTTSVSSPTGVAIAAPSPVELFTAVNPSVGRVVAFPDTVGVVVDVLTPVVGVLTVVIPNTLNVFATINGVIGRVVAHPQVLNVPVIVYAVVISGSDPYILEPVYGILVSSGQTGGRLVYHWTSGQLVIRHTYGRLYR